MALPLNCAGVSVASNIAEGYGRGSHGEYRHFLGMARGSNLELQTQLVITRKLNMGNPVRIDQTEALSLEVNKMLVTSMKRL